jgi:Predicted transcriptional regulators
MPASDKLKVLLEKKGISSYELAQRSGISESTLSRFLNGYTQKLSIKTKELLANCLNVPKEYFDFSDVSEELVSIDGNQIPVMQVPLVSQYAYAGYLSGFADSLYVEKLPKVPFIVDSSNHKGRYICFEVKGDSMNDGTEQSILEGDRLLCRELKRDLWKDKLHYKKYDFVIVHRTEGILIKRVVAHDTELCQITLHSLNDMYDDFVIKLNDVAQLFNVIEINRPRRR